MVTVGGFVFCALYQLISISIKAAYDSRHRVKLVGVFILDTCRVEGYFDFVVTENVCKREKKSWQIAQNVYILLIYSSTQVNIAYFECVSV